MSRGWQGGGGREDRGDEILSEKGHTRDAKMGNVKLGTLNPGVI